MAFPSTFMGSNSFLSSLWVKGRAACLFLQLSLNVQCAACPSTHYCMRKSVSFWENVDLLQIIISEQRVSSRNGFVQWVSMEKQKTTETF